MTPYDKQRDRQQRRLNERRARLLASQGNRCAICGDPEPPYIDHDHACCPGKMPKVSCGKCDRGLLCARCNVGLGYFRDDPGLLEAAAAYLRL